MARPHSLMLWSIVFTFLAAASLCAADAKEPKPKHAKTPAAKSTPHPSEDPFAGHEKHSAASPKRPSKPVVKPLRPWENVARIEAALASPTELVFVEAPLVDVLDYLKQRHCIEIQTDHKALEDTGVGTDSPVTVDLKGISLRSALNLMLRNLNLTWIIEDEVLIITTVEEAETRLDTKVYDVADLVVCRDEHDMPWDDYDSLTDIITSTIKPTSWDGVGGPGSIQGNALGTAKVLVVSQTRDVHEEIAALLAKIREVAKKTPNAGTPRRSKPISPAPQKNGK
ncbi:MAG: hypothetical protein WCB27_15250 [Thermoguttaceae bacterium]